MLLSLIALAVLQDPLAVRADTLHPRNDVLSYDITIVIGDTGTHIVGQVATTWKLNSSDPVILELDSAFRVIRVLMDGKENSRLSRTVFARTGSEIYLPHEKQAGDTLRTLVRYHGDVRDGLVIRSDSMGQRTVFADNWPDRAHLWFPAQDHPSDKATVNFNVEVPQGMQVIANGVLQGIDTLARGHTEWHFVQSQPIPTYGMVLGAGHFAITTLPPAACAIKCVPLSVITFPPDSSWAVNGPFGRAGQIVDYFSQLVGPFPYDRLSHVQSTTIFGGMENPTAIFYDDKAYGSRKLTEETVAHETAHQWFGDAVTEADWHHLWLSEGFATYFASLWIRHADGDSAFRASMQRGAEQVFKSKDTERPILDSAATDLMSLLNSNNYPKGAWVLHSLRGLIGDSAFVRGIREYYRTYRDSTALSADFAAVMSKAAGTDLGWYFSQGLTQPGYPILEISWQQQHNRLSLTIRQTQKPSWRDYRLPRLGLLIDGKAFTVDVTGRETHAVLDGVKLSPQSVVVDPDGWWLLQATVKKD